MTDRLDDLLDGMASDLAKLWKSVPWAEGFAYGKPGRGLDAEHGTDLARTEEEREAGPVYDLGIGDHGARLALQRSIPRLARAEVYLIVANAATGWPCMRPAYAMADPGEVPTTSHIAASVRALIRLVDQLAEHLPGDSSGRSRVERWVFKADKELTKCLGGYSRALEKGEMSKPSVGRCYARGICSKMADLREGGLCSRCARRLRRTGELPSAKELATEAVDEGISSAKAYQNKRIASGAVPGDESLSNAVRLRVVDT